MVVEDRISHTNVGRATYFFEVQFEVLFSLKTGGNELLGSLQRTDVTREAEWR